MEYKELVIRRGENSGFYIKSSGVHVYIDPFKLKDDNIKADLILITHGHYDHCSIEDIKKIIKIGTKIIGPSEILSQISRFDSVNFEIGEVGKRLEFNGISIECVNSYNINKHFHPKEEGYLGYIINFFGTRVYHAGDTDFIPEMIKINADVFLVPVSGKFVMTPDEAIKAVEVINPDLAIPMHYASVAGTKEDAQRFVNLCRNININSIILEKEI